MKISEAEIYLVLNWNSKLSRWETKSEFNQARKPCLRSKPILKPLSPIDALLMFVLLMIEFQSLIKFTNSKYLFLRLHVLVHRKFIFKETNTTRLSSKM